MYLRKDETFAEIATGLEVGTAHLIQIALVDAAGPAGCDVATTMQTVVYNVGVAAGAFVGGLALDHGGAGTLPWVVLQPVIAALVTVISARGTAFSPLHSVGDATYCS